MRWLLSLTFIVMFVGCASKLEYVDRMIEVKVPVKCEVPSPSRPILPPNSDGVRELAIYADQLECVVKLCKGEPCNK